MTAHNERYCSAIELLPYFLPQKMDKASVVMLDRWHIEVSESASGSTSEGDHPSGPSHKIPYNIVNNYFSIGVVSEN